MIFLYYYFNTYFYNNSIYIFIVLVIKYLKNKITAVYNPFNFSNLSLRQTSSKAFQISISE